MRSSGASRRWARGFSISTIGERVGVGWLGRACGCCSYCEEGAENLCDAPVFTGCTRDGGFASHTVADARFVYPLGEEPARTSRWRPCSAPGSSAGAR